jgi:formimidoylglutamate deiminase
MLSEITRPAAFRFATAWLPEGWRRNVVIAIDADGDIVSVTPDDATTRATNVSGAAVPGMPNIHSHAFQRAMAGLTEHRGTGATDSFWTWREAMYRLAGAVTPDVLNAIATQLYVEMLKAGYTAVCEFHYLHHRSGSSDSNDPREMSQALMDAAATAGIGLTLLPTLYQTADLDGSPPTARQEQFALTTDAFINLVGELSTRTSPQLAIGLALHSLRAVPTVSLEKTLAACGRDRVVHIHVAEQQREVERSLAVLGQRPVEWLLDNAPVNERWCLVHATHVTSAEIAQMAARRVVVGLCPTTEANLGDGRFDLLALTAHGGDFAVGSDSHIAIAPTEELRWLEYQARLERRERNMSSRDGASTGATLWRSACLAGARACGRTIGTLAPRARADIVVLDTELPLFCGREGDSIVDTLVFSVYESAVRDVMVGGRWLVQERRHFAEVAIASSYRRVAKQLTTTLSGY